MDENGWLTPIVAHDYFLFDNLLEDKEGFPGTQMGNISEHLTIIPQPKVYLNHFQQS